MRPGLADPVLDSLRVFRGVLDAMAHPGRVVDVGGPGEAPAPLDPAAAALCLTLVDGETPLWLDGAARTGEAEEYLRFHCGAVLVDAPEAARFAVIAAPDPVPPLVMFAQGTAEHPERSATVIVQVGVMTAGRGRRLTGPGIATEAFLDVPALGGGFWTDLRENHGRFPRGVDVVFTAGTAVVALPRTTLVEG